MPVLHQHKDGSGYFVRAALPGTTQIITWQISPEGLRFLRSKGYKGEKFEFNRTLLEELINRGYAYTHGSGIGPIPAPQLWVTPSDLSPPQKSEASRGTSVVFLENAPGWSIALRVAELPRTWFEHTGSLVDALAGWKIHVAGAPPISATQLWPGRGGALIPVAPQPTPYTVTPEGQWPGSWDLRRWLGNVPGLDAGATLFSADTGERLDRGAALDLGGAYFLVALADPASGRGCWPPPTIFAPEDLGRNGLWQAWAIELPASSGIRVRAWCEASGYRLAEPRYRLSLITPPDGYDESGLPIVAVGEEVVLGLTPIHEDAAARHGPTFYSTRFQAPGTYRVAIDDRSTAAISVVARRPETSLPSQPAALELCITWAGSAITIQALRDGSGPHAIPTAATIPGKPATVEVTCAVPLSLRWEIGVVRERRDRIAADEANVVIAGLLCEAARRREQLGMQIDAGAYGRIGLTMPALVSTASALYALPPPVMRRARWLAAALSNEAVQGAMVPIPPRSRPALARLATLPGCAALRGLRTVPASLMPHVHAITKLVQ